MPRPITRLPKYREHKASSQAIVTLDGRDHYLGPHGSAASKAEYNRLVGEWQVNGRRSPVADGDAADLRVVELAAAFWKHAQDYYHPPGGHRGEVGSFKLALHQLKKLYGHTRAAEFGPLALETVRQSMTEAGWCRTYVNRQTGRIKQVFKWGVARQMVPANVYAALRSLEGLKVGRSKARESDPVKPVPDARVEATKEHLSPVVRAMVDLQLLTGMRPGEVCQMRTARVALAAGFRNAKQLGSGFHHETGVTATAYRRQSRRQVN